MFEKERTRLRSEEIRINQRMEIILGRLKEIQDYYDEKSGEMHSGEDQPQKKIKPAEAKPEWKTMSIDY
jgi:hypothetical protein